jgi:hypothetical protein
MMEFINEMRIITGILFFLWAIPGFGQTDQDPESETTGKLEEIFLNPPESAKPGVMWMWMGCNISADEITRDLEALHDAGFGRVLMFNVADVTTPWPGKIYNSPTPEIIAWTEPWWKLVCHAVKESKRLGIDFGMFNGPGYSTTGGPWISAEMSMQEVCFSQLAVTGGRHVNVALDQPLVDARSNTRWLSFNPETGKVEKPEIPERKTYYRDIAVLALPANGIVPIDQIIDLGNQVDASGLLNWDAPPGAWIVYRFGHTTMGNLLQPPQWEARGFECDKMSVEAVTFHMSHVIGEIRRHLGPLVGNGFSFVHLDSYEAGKPSWTPKMREEFLTRRGYDLIPFLPVFAHRIISNDSKTAKFQEDFDATIMDLYRDVHFAVTSKMLKDAGLVFSAEPYGGPWRFDEIMPYINQVITEFWTNGGKFTPYHLDETISAVRKSGQNIVEAEAFTGWPTESQWSETPAWLKPIGDAAYCAGVNRFILHRFVPQPWDERYKPGNAMGQWGTHFDRTQTWWEPGKAMVRYWQRCNALLQWGRYASTPGDCSVIITQAAGLKLSAIHRRNDLADVYFIANTDATSSGGVTCAFAVNGKQPELWDPVWGTLRNLPEFEQHNGQTLIPLKFAAAQSYFIVFRHKIDDRQSGKKNFPTFKSIAEITGPWLVSFDPKWGGPYQPVEFGTLEDWTMRPEPGIKYYSGTAIYRKSFDLPESKKMNPLFFSLGTVNHLARIRLNGQDLGVVWCAPWTVNIPPKLLMSSDNKLEIEITTTWANRLIGDEQEPADCEWLPGHMGGQFLKAFPDWFVKGQPRPSKGRYCFTTWNYFKKDSPLQPSGLLGPVTILSSRGMNNKF